MAEFCRPARICSAEIGRVGCAAAHQADAADEAGASDGASQLIRSVFLDKILRLFRAAWAPLAVVLGHGAAASLFGHPRQLDPGLHFLGGAAVAYFLCHGSEIIAPILGPLTLFARLALAFTGACTVALFWELGEFLSDTYLGTYVQGGLTDTIVDLLLGVGGAAVFVLAHLLVTTRFMQAVLSRIESDRVAAPEDAV